MKKNVLLVWWYDRKDLIAPFLEMQDDIEFTVLFYRYPEQEDPKVAENIPFRKIYWLDYNSPYSLLKDVQPEKVLFFGNESVLSISLIAAANILSIPTCYVSHGLRTDLSEIIRNISQVQTIERYQSDNKYYTSKKWHTILFLLNVISWKNLKSVSLVFKILASEFSKLNSFEKLLNNQHPLRKTSRYYLFAPENALMLKELDQVPESSIDYTGPYMMDQIFKDLNKNKVEEGKDWLLIDQPLNKVSFDQKVDLYYTIAQVAKSKNANLIVKLHPMEYHRQLEDTDNIIWKKNVDDMSLLIAQSKGVIGFYSALLLPIIALKKCIIFDTNTTILTKKWEEIGVVKSYNFYDFQPKDIDFDNFQIEEESRQKFINQFVVYTDGLCTQRLKSLILYNN